MRIANTEHDLAAEVSKMWTKAQQFQQTLPAILRSARATEEINLIRAVVDGFIAGPRIATAGCF